MTEREERENERDSLCDCVGEREAEAEVEREREREIGTSLFQDDVEELLTVEAEDSSRTNEK